MIIWMYEKCKMCVLWNESGGEWDFVKNESEIRRGLNIDLSLSRNSVIMCRGCMGDGDELAVISMYDDFAIGFDPDRFLNN